jgi:hypothetical protein
MANAWAVWAALAAVAAIGGCVVVRTRWLQSRTLEKCIGLSLVIHAVLAVVCAFVGGLAPVSWGTLDEGRMTMLVMVADDTDEAGLESGSTSEAVAHEPPAPPTPAADSVAERSGDEFDPVSVVPPADLVPLLDVPGDSDSEQTVSSPSQEAVGSATEPEIPTLYRDRIGSRRAAAAAARGGSPDTERAVEAALAWLVQGQSSDGRWSAARHGAGAGRSAGGQHHPGVGARSDTGVTGLALLAFLGAGSTHRQGAHADTVDRGLRFLAAGQRADGSLAGEAEFFAALYCHGMATLALAECAAMSGDLQLRPALERAVRYTLSMQHPVTGGWRYAAGDRGDTSQLGWQVMVLSSARQAGLSGLEAAEMRARGFLQSVSSGAAGGLASYRPGERPSVTMTAEALVCRILLGMPADHPTATEALALIERHSPDRSAVNAYTWYYATLAAFHCGGVTWERWNERLHAALLPLQRREHGPLDGSWDPDSVWGGHGGRVYATALAALTLEVYYRYQPIHRAEDRVALGPR